MYNANNYGYQPYGRYMPQQTIEQPQQFVPQTKPILNGKQVESIDIVKNCMEIPLDGSISYFPLTSGDTIVTKQLQMDGTSKIKIYKLVNDEDDKETNYITIEDLNKAIEKIDLSEIDEIREELNQLRKDIKFIKKKSE